MSATRTTGYAFVGDVRQRVSGPVQIATDQLPSYAGHIRMHFGYEGYCYGTETKVFGEPHLPDGTLARLGTMKVSARWCVEMTAEYCRRKEDAKFEAAFAAFE